MLGKACSEPGRLALSNPRRTPGVLRLGCLVLVNSNGQEMGRRRLGLLHRIMDSDNMLTGILVLVITRICNLGIRVRVG